MNEREALAKGDTVEIIDKRHAHFGEIGSVVDLRQQPRKILNNPQNSGITTIVEIKLKDSDKTLCFESYPRPLNSQIKKL
jgi:hypothetical protein